MIFPSEKWYSAIEKRRSRRHFDASRPIEPDALSAMQTICEEFRPFSSARVRLVTGPVDGVFRGVIGGYGKVTGAPAFVAFIGDMSSQHVQEQVGYTGEGIVLEATGLGLSTCWVAGFFSRKVVSSQIQLQKGERVLAVSPLGYAPKPESVEERSLTGFGLTHRRVASAKLLMGSGSILPQWIKTAIEAARLAPSAVNRQPWGFEIGENSVTVHVRTSGPDFSVSKRLDCGIAMLHIELAALHNGLKGQWQFLDGRSVARFTLSP